MTNFIGTKIDICGNRATREFLQLFLSCYNNWFWAGLENQFSVNNCSDMMLCCIILRHFPRHNKRFVQFYNLPKENVVANDEQRVTLAYPVKLQSNTVTLSEKCRSPINFAARDSSDFVTSSPCNSIINHSFVSDLKVDHIIKIK